MTRIPACLAVLAAAVALAQPAAAAERTLKLLVFHKGTSIMNVAVDDFANKINADGKGVLQVQMPLVGPSAIPPAQMGNAVKNGIVDIAAVPASYVQRLTPIITGLAAAEIAPAMQRKNGAIEMLEAQLNKSGVHFLGQYGDFPYHIFTSKPVKTLDDFKGVRMRASGTYKPLFDALGAQPVMLGLSETFDAMQRGIVTGYGNVNNQIKLLGWLPVTKYRIDPGFYHATLVNVMNLKTWNALDARQKAVLTAAEDWLDGPRSAELAAEDAALGKALEKQGVEAIQLPPADAAKFLELAHNSLWKVINQRDPENGPKLEKLLSK